MYAGLIIALVLIIFLVIAFCTFFTARLAQLKKRSKLWGVAGLVFGIAGLVFVSYLPSKREDGIETNPIKHFLKKLPPLSKKTAIAVGAIGAAVVLSIVLYENIPVLIKNYKYESEISKQNLNTEQPKAIEKEIANVFLGANSSYAIANDGSVYCFGHQFVDSIELKAKKVLSNDSSVYVLDVDGTLYGSVDGELVKISDKVVDFSISEATVAFIKTDDKLYMYGNNAHCQINNSDEKYIEEPTLVMNKVNQVVCEATFTVVLKNSGEVYTFGESFIADQTVTDEPEKIFDGGYDIAAGDNFIMVLTSNNELNILNKGATEFTVVATNASHIASAKTSALYVTTENELYAMFNNNVGQLGTKGKYFDTPKLVKKQVADIATSGLHTVITMVDGDILSSGYNNCGQLGLGDSRNKFSKFITINK